ncbi:MAPK/MAK/MRK overlapping kinase [Manacus vitellinus]|uniref:MAPK/MAK/MRK overlapping kinase n=1 Tax=Manacus vitellinus TaxID=328815 RepID=UPI000847274D|nr:MAPK/MAK/MRK overlapping kinase [Manacus vitellinus]
MAPISTSKFSYLPKQSSRTETARELTLEGVLTPGKEGASQGVGSHRTNPCQGLLSQIPVGRIGEGAFSDVLQTLSLRNGKYYACKHMKQHFERVHEAVIRSGLALSSPYGSFLGPDELDQISKIHIIGTLAKTTLKKFKQLFRAADTQALTVHKKLRLLRNT